ncbi:sugar phosphate isomerase/epimerase [bacterium]|nr:sugar phosphate isomerase/epimerase [bacterium]
MKFDIYFHAPFDMILKHLKDIAAYHINLEICMNPAELDCLPLEEMRKVKNFCLEEDIRTSCHGPYIDLNPGSEDPKVRSLVRERFVQSIQFCSKMDIKNLVLHTGYSPVFHESIKDIWFETSLDLWKEIKTIAEEKEIKIAIENCLESSPEIVVRLLNEIGSENFGMCFDVAHFNVFGDKPVLDYFDICTDRIFEVHLSDNNGDKDSHLAFGKGNINFQQLFHRLKEKNLNPIITVEAMSIEDVIYDIKYLENVDWF